MRIRFAVLGATVLATIALRSADDPILGTWKLNLAKSKYSPGPPPQSQVRSYAKQAGGIKVLVDTMEAGGQPTHAEFVVRYDLKGYPVAGASPFDTISPEKIDERTVNAELKQGDRVVLNAMRSVSKDGKTLTITYVGTSEQGKPVNNLAVFSRQ